MKSYLINLNRDVEKAERMRREFGRLGIDFTRVSAVDGRTFSKDEFIAFCGERPLGNGDDPSRAWNPGVMGCFLSHKATWERIAKGHEPAAAIFEDDIHLSPKLPAFLSSFEWMPDDADVVHFETTWHSMRLGSATKNHDGVAVRRCYSNAWGAAGYVMSKEAARILLALASNFHAPTDHFLFDRRTEGAASILRSYQLDPALVVQDHYHPVHPNSLGYQTTTHNFGETDGFGRRLRLFIRPAARVLLRRRVVCFDGVAAVGQPLMHA